MSEQKSNRLPAWNVTQLFRMMNEDLKDCQTQTERSCAKAICEREIRDKASEWSKTRKLTPGEVACALECGWRV